MELSAMMASQVRDLQQTVQLSVLNNAMNMNTASAIQLLQDMPQPQAAAHPYKGTVVDVQA